MLKSNHADAWAKAREVCQLESTGQLVTKVVVALIAIFVLWYSSGPNEAYSEIALKAGAILAIILIFPTVYIWSLLSVTQRLKRNATVALIIAGILLTLGGVSLVGFGIFKLAARPGDPRMTDIQGQLAAIQAQLSANKSEAATTIVSAVGSTKKEKPIIRYSEKDTREILDGLTEASELLEKRIFPATNKITEVTANWIGHLRNRDVKGMVSFLKELDDKIPGEVWKPIDDLLDKYGREPVKQQMRNALALDHDAAKGEMSRALRVAIAALAKLPESPSEETLELVKPQFKTAYNQAEVTYNWYTVARSRIASMTESMKTRGVTGLD